MATVKFGTDQIKNPTPANLANWINGYTVVASVILAWIGTSNFIPAGLSSTIQSILGLTIGIANALKPFFGVETKQKTVPIEDVKAMETK